MFARGKISRDRKEDTEARSGGTVTREWPDDLYPKRGGWNSRGKIKGRKWPRPSGPHL